MDAVKKLYVVESLGGFLWRIAKYIRHGYTSYVVRSIPEGKDLAQVDRTIIRAYDCTYNSNIKKKRRKEGRAIVAYLRHKRTVVLLATPGEHEEFYKSADVRSIFQSPIYYSGYSIGIEQHKPCVKIAPKRFKKISNELHRIALHDHRKVISYFQGISPFTFKGVADQRWKLFREIQKRRAKAGLKGKKKKSQKSTIRGIEWIEVNTWKGKKLGLGNGKKAHKKV